MKKKFLALAITGVMVFVLTVCCSSANEVGKTLNELKAEIIAQYGENKKITGDYDESLAVKCINGTFVGRRNDGVIAYKGIPFVGKQPVREYRWKAPVDVMPDDGVYEAYYNGKSCIQSEHISEGASLYVQGEDCLYLNIWKADEKFVEKKPLTYSPRLKAGDSSINNKCLIAQVLLRLL